MSDNKNVKPFDWSLKNIGGLFIAWLIGVLLPTITAGLIMLLCYFQNSIVTGIAWVLGFYAGPHVIPLAFAFERTGIVILDILISIVTEVLVAAGLFAVMVVCYNKSSPFHSITYPGLMSFGVLYSLYWMVASFFVTRKSQLESDKSTNAPSDEQTAPNISDNNEEESRAQSAPISEESVIEERKDIKVDSDNTRPLNSDIALEQQASKKGMSPVIPVVILIALIGLGFYFYKQRSAPVTPLLNINSKVVEYNQEDGYSRSSMSRLYSYLEDPDLFFKAFTMPKEDVDEDLLDKLEHPVEGVEISHGAFTKDGVQHYVVMIFRPREVRFSTRNEIFDYLQDVNMAIKCFPLQTVDEKLFDEITEKTKGDSRIDVRVREFEIEDLSYTCIIILNKTL